MPVPNVFTGDRLRVIIACRAGGQNGLNIREFFVKNAGANPAPLDALAVALSAEFAGNYKAVISDQAEFYGIGIQRIFPLPTPVFSSRVDTGPGTDTGDLMSPQTAGIISLKSGTMGRRHNGRMFVPFPSENANGVNGMPSGTYRNNLAAIGDLFTTDLVLSAGGIGPVTLRAQIRSKFVNPSDDVEFAVVRSAWGTIRRRSFTRHGDLVPF